MNKEKTHFVDVTHPPGLNQRLKHSAFLRLIVREMKSIYREVVFTANAARSGRLFVYQRNHALSRRLSSQKVITYTIDLPPFRDFHALTAWLGENSMPYQEGAFCIYIPPRERTRKLFGSVLSAYPPDAGLKILKELKAPSEAKYLSRDVRPRTTKVSDWISYRPLDYLRVANYMYDKGVGPRVYDLVEIQTPHNSLSAYVMQHVAGTVPSVKECTAFLMRLNHLYEDQLVPLLPDWRAANDFLCPGCHGNLIRDGITGNVLYVDFQTFMIRDAKRYTSQIADGIQGDLHLGNTYRSIPGLRVGKQDVDSRWDLFRQMLQRQTVSVEGSVVFDVGCGAGMIMYSALTEGAAWAVGWDRPAVAAAARKLLLSLGMTRFNIVSENITPDTDFPSNLPENVKSSNNSILLFLAMRKRVGFPDSVKNLPFTYMVYEDHEGASLSDVKDHLKEIVDGWGLRIVDVASYIDGDSKRERVIAILRRD